KAMGADFYARQAEMMKPVCAESDIVITTAAVPGQKAPVLITRDMVEAMRPGSVVVELAAERGGHCVGTQPGRTVLHQGVTVIGPLNVPSSLASNASQLFAKNTATFLGHLARDGSLTVDREDEITRETLVTWNGEVVHPRVRERLSLPPL